MKRRTFLHHTAHSVAIPGILGSLGIQAQGHSRLKTLINEQVDNDRVLVLIFLDGGNDGLNTVIPFSQLSAMEVARPHVMLPEQKIHRLFNQELGLHPSLAGFKSLYNEKRLGIIQSVGYPNPNFSHFRSSDIWMSGSDSDQYVNSGWTGRYLDQLHPDYPEAYPNQSNPHPLAIEIGYGASLLFQGSSASMSMVLSGPDSFYDLIDGIEPETPDTPAGEKLNYIRLIARQSQQYGQVVREASQRAIIQVPYPETGLAQQLKIVSRLIAGGLQTPLYMVRIGGFDTHDSQVETSDTTQGLHAELLKELNDAILAFMADLDRQRTADRVVGMTFSEFGRTIISNASNGTDHGTSGPMFVFGNAVRGGVIGENPILPARATWEDDLRMQYDFRSVYASILEQWFGLENQEERNSILQYDFDTLPVIGESDVVSGLGTSGLNLTVYPNPLADLSLIEFNSSGQLVQIELLDMNGRLVQKVYRGSSAEGRSRIEWRTQTVPNGQFLLRVSGSLSFEVFKVIK